MNNILFILFSVYLALLALLSVVFSISVSGGALLAFASVVFFVVGLFSLEG